MDSTSSGALQFVNQGSGSYNILLTIIELDGTSTIVNRIVVPEGTQTRIKVSGASHNISIRQVGNSAFLSVHGEDILVLNNAQTAAISSRESLTYQSREIAINDRKLALGIPNLYFYDGLRFYRFEGEILDTLDGPGVFYFNTATDQGLYSIDTNLNTNLNRVISTLGTTPTDPDPEVVAVVTTAAPTQLPPATTRLPTSTDAQTPPTTDAPEATEEPEECDEEETDKSTTSSRKHTPDKEKTEKSSTRRDGASDQVKSSSKDSSDSIHSKPTKSSCPKRESTQKSHNTNRKPKAEAEKTRSMMDASRSKARTDRDKMEASPLRKSKDELSRRNERSHVRPGHKNDSHTKTLARAPRHNHLENGNKKEQKTGPHSKHMQHTKREHSRDKASREDRHHEHKTRGSMAERSMAAAATKSKTGTREEESRSKSRAERSSGGNLSR